MQENLIKKLPDEIARMQREITAKQQQVQVLRELQPAWVRYEALQNQVSCLIWLHAACTVP